MSDTIVMIDYGMGNLHSVNKRFKYLNTTPVISSDPEVIAAADKIILPGVGHFGKAMENLKQLNLIEILNDFVWNQKKPILGICLGMQLMAKSSEEGDVKGLGWFDANVVRFKVSNTLLFKVPHTGWNQIKIAKHSLLMENIPDLSEMYFVHSYHFQCANEMDILNTTDYDYSFTSAVEKNNIFGVQYHPEKSHDTGAQLLKNFIDL